MKRLYLSLLIAATSLLASCASPYKEQVSGPIAYARFVDKMGPSLWGTRKTGAWLFEHEDCSDDAQGVSGTDWVKVPADKVLVLSQMFSNEGYGLIQVSCKVRAGFMLHEGQHVEFEYNLDFQGTRVTCNVIPYEVEAISASKKVVQVLRAAPAACKS